MDKKPLTVDDLIAVLSKLPAGTPLVYRSWDDEYSPIRWLMDIHIYYDGTRLITQHSENNEKEGWKDLDDILAMTPEEYTRLGNILG